MAKSWIALRAGWKLEDVQAVLNVVISFLSSMGIFVFARFCWHGTAARVGRSQNVRLPSLLSLSTPGEVLDIFLFLKFKLLFSPYLNLFAQSVVVITLSTTAVLSGLITRYSTQRGYMVTRIEVPGLLATNKFSSINYANVEWNQIQTSLNRAGFPTNQLLDFLPNTSIDWVYRPEEWNSTWSLTCEPTLSTPFTVSDTGNCSSLSAEMPALQDILPTPFRDDWYFSNDGIYINNTWTDVLIFIVAPIYTDVDKNTNITYAMNISIASIHLSGIQRQLNDSSNCYYTAGDVKQASYTRVDCGLTRLRHIPDEHHHAYPDSGNVYIIPRAYQQYYQARFTQESMSNSVITVITPDELVRFYQTYVISKDIMYREPVTRTLSVQIPIVELSTAFLTVWLLVALLLAAGLAKYIFFMVRHQTTMLVTPESKLDWMLQSIKEASESSPFVGYCGLRRSENSVSPITSSEDLSDLPKSAALMKAEFQAATFGSLDPESQMLGQKRVRRGSTLIGGAATGNRMSWTQQPGVVEQANSGLLRGQHPAFANHESCCGR